jgi:hypothetical protein
MFSNKPKNSPNFSVSEWAVRELDQLLSLASKGGENGATIGLHILDTHCCFHSILIKATKGFVTQIGSQGLVLWVLEATDTSKTCLANMGHIGEEMTQSTVMILSRYVGLEEWINRGALGLFEVVWYRDV